MKWPHLVLAVLGILVPIGAALQGVTFSYVVSIEHRLTRLETLQEAAKVEPRRQVLEPAVRVFDALPRLPPSPQPGDTALSSRWERLPGSPRAHRPP